MPSRGRNEVLVTAEWVEERLKEFRSDDPSLMLAEVDVDPETYDDGHAPGAVKFDWEEDLAAGSIHDIVDREGFEELLAANGFANESTIVLYGDRANWFAAHAYWLFRYYGHDDVKLVDGGRHYWTSNDLPVTEAVPEFPTRAYEADDPDASIRARSDEVREAIDGDGSIIDVRNPQEYRGDGPPADIPDTSDREGHIPSAENIYWAEAINADGTFKPDDVLAEIYDDRGEGDDTAIAYCRIGERSSITWFVLHELLGRDALNYDGSWTEWADIEDAPIERGE